MRYFALKLSFIFLISLSIPSYSEGNCPAGYYPIGGQGVSGCAPMSTGGTGAPQATGEWQTRWGALARNDDSSILGVSSKERSKSAARSTALKFCKEAGGKKCEVKVYYKNSCVAQAASKKLGRSNVYVDGYLDQAKQNALRKCGSDDCEITYADCSEAEFRKYR
ncbi:DUF4189 domain-containing protein [Xanthomonas arboricola]